MLFTNGAFQDILVENMGCKSLEELLQFKGFLILDFEVTSSSGSLQRSMHTLERKKTLSDEIYTIVEIFIKYGKKLETLYL